MASVRRDIVTRAPAAAVWEALRDVGALHTRLVPGFVVATRLEPGARVVTFGNGTTVREPIVTVDEQARRVVWTSESALTTHYNSAAEVLVDAAGRTHVVWISDFLPEEAREKLEGMMTAGAEAMKRTLDALVT